MGDQVNPLPRIMNTACKFNILSVNPLICLAKFGHPLFCSTELHSLLSINQSTLFNEGDTQQC